MILVFAWCEPLGCGTVPYDARSWEALDRSSRAPRRVPSTTAVRWLSVRRSVGSTRGVRTTTAVRTASLPLLVTRRELVAAGIDLDIALRATRRGSWTEVVPGAWWRAPVDVTRGLRQTAALQLLGPAAALTGVDACQHYGLRDVPEDGRVDVVVPHRLRRDLGPSVRLHRTTLCVDSDVMAGRRWARPVRAVHDACTGRPLQDVRALVAAAVGDGWVGSADLRRLVDAGPRRGSAALRRALDDVDAGARSAPEAEAAEAVADAVRRRRLPPFLLNPRLLLDGRLVLVPDLWLVGTGLGAELDSVRHHGSYDALDATLDRHERAAAYGIVLVHRSPRRLRADPAGLVDELVRRLPDCPAPPGLVVVPQGPVLPGPRRQR